MTAFPARLVALAFLVLGARGARAADFIGPESCRACHPAAYQAWKNGPHAKAMASLSPDEQKNGICLACHAPDQAKGGDAAVTCETCHGAGQLYAPDYVMKDKELAQVAGLVVPDQKSCGLCHDAMSPSLTPFDPAAKLPLIDHWTADKAARARKGETGELCPRGHPRDFLARALARPARKEAGASAVRLAEARRARARKK